VFFVEILAASVLKPEVFVFNPSLFLSEKPVVESLKHANSLELRHFFDALLSAFVNTTFRNLVSNIPRFSINRNLAALVFRVSICKSELIFIQVENI
jgi:hypothetical protein